MTVNDILAKMYEIDKIIDTLSFRDQEFYLRVDKSGDHTIDVEKLENVLEDYKSMLGNMKVKE